MTETDYKPFKPVKPGDLISDEVWHGMQIAALKEIDERVGKAIENLKLVDRATSADDSALLDGKSFDELTEAIIEEVKKIIPENKGYQKLFKVLEVGEQSVIEHGLQHCPLVDVYQLDYFEVVCAQDDDKFKKFVTFYLYHSSEKKLRYKDPGTNALETVEVETKDRPIKIPFDEMLRRYNVAYGPSSSLGDLESEFWDAFFADPNDQFDPDQYGHSPWFERCCREEKTVAKLKANGDWDELWFQVRPRKTINYTERALVGDDEPIITRAPSHIQVEHFDFNTLAVTLLQSPPFEVPGRPVPGPNSRPKPLNELKVMLLLKV